MASHYTVVVRIIEVTEEQPEKIERGVRTAAAVPSVNREDGNFTVRKVNRDEALAAAIEHLRLEITPPPENGLAPLAESYRKTFD